MKKKFEIIEEGRLSKSEMQTLVGSGNSCPGGAGNYTVDTCTKNGDMYSICKGSTPDIYASCTPERLISCSGTYAGPQGPNGNSQPGVGNPGGIIAEPIGNVGDMIYAGPPTVAP